jgi:hypothetical protein
MDDAETTQVVVLNDSNKPSMIIENEQKIG